MTRTLELTFGTRTYDVPQAPIKLMKAWRLQLKAPLEQVLAAISSATTVQLTTTSDITALVTQVLPILLEAVDTLLDLTYAYAPILAANAAYIEEEGYDDQVVAAFLAILKVAFPLEQLMALLGPASPATSKNLPTPPGDVTPPSLTSSN